MNALPAWLPVTSTMEKMYAFQQQLASNNATLSTHQGEDDAPYHPDILFIGCIDARLDLERLGITPERSLIRRTIAALVPHYKKDHPEQDFSETIEHALSRGVKHIIVMGHTQCGGLDACFHGVPKHLQRVADHLRIIDESPLIDAQAKHAIDALEPASIHVSLDNLRSYPGIKEAEAKGQLTLHGLLANTKTYDIQEYDEASNALKKMRLIKKPGDTSVMVSDFISLMKQEPPCAQRLENPDIHEPELLMITGIDTHINPTSLHIEYGKALIYRGFDPCAARRTDEKAALEFAIEVKRVKDVVLMLPKGSEEKLRQGIENLQHNHTVQQALAKKEIQLHGWIVDPSTHRIAALDPATKQFMPLGKTS